MLKATIALIFQKGGWKFSGKLPKRAKKTIFVSAPHTAKRDFFLAVAIVYLTKFTARIAVSDKYNWFPSNFFLRYLGAKFLPANDKKTAQRTLFNLFNDRARYSIIITPGYGLRSEQDWDESFYDLSVKTGAAICMVSIDRPLKKVNFHTHFFPSNDRERDLAYVRKWFGSLEKFESEDGVLAIDTQSDG